MLNNINIDYRVLGKHFVNRYSNERSAISAFRQLKKKYDETGKGMWDIYIRAYNYDIELSKK